MTTDELDSFSLRTDCRPPQIIARPRAPALSGRQTPSDRTAAATLLTKISQASNPTYKRWISDGITHPQVPPTPARQTARARQPSADRRPHRPHNRNRRIREFHSQPGWKGLGVADSDSPCTGSLQEEALAGLAETDVA